MTNVLQAIPAVVLLIISVIASATGTAFRNVFSKSYTRNNADIYLYLLVCNIMTAALLVVTSTDFSVSWFTLITAVVFGLLVIFCTFANNKGLNCGPMGMFTMISSFSTAISALSGVMFFGETLSWSKVCGMLCMLAMVVVTANFSKSGQKRIPMMFYVFCGIALLTNSGVGIMQKVHQSSEFKGELDMFLIISFVLSSIVPIAGYFQEKRHGHAPTIPLSPKHAPFWLCVIGAVCTVIPHRFNLYLSGVLESIIFFPIVNGGSLMLVLLSAFVIFKERPTVRQLIGIGLGFLAIFLFSGIV